MIYPGTHDITVLQNSTWKGQFRVTDSAKPVSINVATAVFTSPCHGLSAGDIVCISPANTESSLSCGISVNDIYYVIASGLTNNEFKISSTLGGSSVLLHGTAVGTFLVSKPIDITSFVIDSDIKGLTDDLFVESFTASMVDAANGKFQLLLTPAETLLIEPGRYGYDVSLTAPGGERYYWLTGVVTMQKTYSRE